MLRVFSPKSLCWLFLRRLNRCWWLLLDSGCIGDKSRHQHLSCRIQYAAYYVGNRLKRYQHEKRKYTDVTNIKNSVSLNQIISKNCLKFASQHFRSLIISLFFVNFHCIYKWFVWQIVHLVPRGLVVSYCTAVSHHAPSFKLFRSPL